MREVRGSAALLRDNNLVSAGSVGDAVESEDDLMRGDEVHPSACRIVLPFIIVLALVNVTATVMMLRG
jgi:hypothetical protein